MICESAQGIDVRRWARDGQLVPGRSFRCSWMLDGEPYGSIQVRVGTAAVVLRFAVRIDDRDKWKSVEQQVPLVWTRCHLGGIRRWFCCTAESDSQRCGRRAALLYLGQGLIFACRRCCGLTYASQLERVGRRGLGRARKIRVNLGGGPNLLEPFPSRPKGMHAHTYNRLRRTYVTAAARCGAL